MRWWFHSPRRSGKSPRSATSTGSDLQPPADKPHGVRNGDVLAPEEEQGAGGRVQKRLTFSAALEDDADLAPAPSDRSADEEGQSGTLDSSAPKEGASGTLDSSAPKEGPSDILATTKPTTRGLRFRGKSRKYKSFSQRPEVLADVILCIGAATTPAERTELVANLRSKGLAVLTHHDDHMALHVGPQLYLLLKERQSQTVDLTTRDGPDEPTPETRAGVALQAKKIALDCAGPIATEALLAHDHARLSALRDTPFSDAVSLSHYWGNEVGLYFAWTTLYMQLLGVLAAVGCGVCVYEQLYPFGRWDGFTSLWFNMFVGLWTTMVEMLWVRAAAMFAVRTSSLGNSEIEHQIELVKSLEEDGMQNRFSRDFERIAIVGLGYVLLLGGNLMAVVLIQYVMDLGAEAFNDSWILGNTVPTLLATLWPLVGSFFNDIFAPILNALEDYPTPDARAQALMLERFAFSLVNDCGTILYVTVYKQDLARARWLLLNFLVVKHFIMKILVFLSGSLAGLKEMKERMARKMTEAAVAFVWQPPQATKISGDHLGGGSSDEPDPTKRRHSEKVGQPGPGPNGSRWGDRRLVESIVEEIGMPEYSADKLYVESLVEYAFLALFCTILPISPLFALINTVMNTLIDKQNLFRSRRPDFKRMELMCPPIVRTTISVLACIFNCWLLWLSLEQEVETRDRTVTAWDLLGARARFGELDLSSQPSRMMFVVALEHILLLFKVTGGLWLSMEPRWVAKLRAEKYRGLLQPGEMVRSDEGVVDGAPKDHRKTNSSALEAAKWKAAKVLAPTFGIPASRLFALFTGTVLVCTFDSMPYGISRLWLIPFFATYLGYYTARKRSIDRHAAIGIVTDPELIEAIVQEMPTWYTQPEVEQVRWLNTVLSELWPFVDEGVTRYLHELLDPILAQYQPVRNVTKLGFSRLSLGSIPPKITGVKATEAQSDEVFLDVDLKWAGDLSALLEVGVKRMPSLKIELADISISTTVRINMSPLVPALNPIGSINVSLLGRPDIDFNFRVQGLDAMSLQVPYVMMVADTVTSKIKDQLVHSLKLVYPRHMCFPLVDEVELAKLSSPLPRGLVRVTVEQAMDLPRMDGVFMGNVARKLGNKDGIKGSLVWETLSAVDGKMANAIGWSADPFVVLSCGTQETRTKTIKKTLHPEWNEHFIFLVYDRVITEVDMVVYDDDTAGSADLIGRCSISLADMAAGSHMSRTIPIITSIKTESPPLLRVSASYINISRERKTGDDDTDIYQHDLLRRDSDIMRDSATFKNPTTGMVGVVCVRDLEFHGIRTVGSAKQTDRLHDAKLFAVVECEGSQSETRKQKNEEILKFWESSDLVVKNPTESQLVIKLMRPENKIVKATKKMVDLTARGTELGRLTVAASEVLTVCAVTGAEHVVEKRDMDAASTSHGYKVTGQVSCSLTWVANEEGFPVKHG